VVETPLIERAAILEATLRVADQHGPDAVSVYAVARQLHVETADLRRHVDGADDLLDILVEALLTRFSLRDVDGAWDDRLVAMATAIRETARGYPTVFPLLLTRPVVTPEAVAVRDAVFAALRDGGLPESAIPRVQRLISTAVVGFAASEAGGLYRMQAQEVADADFAELLRWLLQIVVPSLLAADASQLRG
jgi:AcrR family transcriptional regulator